MSKICQKIKVEEEMSRRWNVVFYRAAKWRAARPSLEIEAGQVWNHSFD